jgi:hypothetical protein
MKRLAALGLPVAPAIIAGRLGAYGMAGVVLIVLFYWRALERAT